MSVCGAVDVPCRLPLLHAERCPLAWDMACPGCRCFDGPANASSLYAKATSCRRVVVDGRIARTSRLQMSRPTAFKMCVIRVARMSRWPRSSLILTAEAGEPSNR